MSRVFAIVCMLFAFGLFMGVETADAQAVKAQMVKGNIKEVQLDKGVLIVNQKVKNEFVDRELSILDTTEFVINGEKVSGSKGLEILDKATNKAKGAMVQIKCDKDVNVLQVKVTLKTK